ncbi:MAG: NifB/NifX family molybdenum-iron cluster-binding protein [Pseudomonadota bacterium]
MSRLVRRLKIINNHYDASAVRIAFATNDGTNVNQHFGMTECIAKYELSSMRYCQIEIAEFSPNTFENIDNKLAEKIEVVEDCVAIYCVACGASAVKKLIDKKVQPLKVFEEKSIATLLTALQRELQDKPVGWLATAIREKQVGQLERLQD